MIAISPLKSIIDDQISEMSCTAMKLKFALRKSTSTFSITKLKYLFSCNKKLQAKRVVKDMSTLQLHLRSTNPIRNAYRSINHRKQ